MKNNYVLFTDTDTDITPKVAEEYGYHVISIPYTVDGKEVFHYKYFEEFDYHTFYESLRSGTMPTTSAINQEVYIEYFEPILKEGKDILYVHFSRAMSGSFAQMDFAIKQLKVLYPESKLTEFAK